MDDHLDRVNRLSELLPQTDPRFTREINKTFYSDIQGEIYSTSADKNPYYFACSVCNKKIDPVINYCFRKCAGSIPIAKSTTSFNIADATGAINASAFNEQCTLVFGFDAEFLKLLDEGSKTKLISKKDPNMKDFIRKCFIQQFRFRIQSYMSYYDKKISVKHNIINCTKIEPISSNSDLLQ
jgi:hypothetical protein